MTKLILITFSKYIPYILLSMIISLVTYILLMTAKPEVINEIIISSLTTNYSNIRNPELLPENKVLGIYDIEKEYSYTLSQTDFRAVVFDEYFRINNSPLQGLGEDFVRSCKLFGAPEDCTVVVAIAKIETNLCNYGPSQDQQNCWGFGGAGENRYIFDSYRAGINLVTSRLVNSYGTYFMVNPDAMEMTYCGPRPTCAVWGDNVQSVMNDLNNLSIRMGYVPLYSLRSSDYNTL